MKNIKYSWLFIALLLSIIIIGCGKDDSQPLQSTQDVLIADPSDNASSIRLDKKIQLTFAKPVNKGIVENNFHLINQRNMQDSSCDFGKSMMHGDMSEVMMDSSKMNHFMDDHSTQGSFNWNSDYTQCTFTPDSLLDFNTDYMMHFGEEMIKMMDEKMGDMMEGGMMGGNSGGMSGMGTSEMTGHMMWHFTTIDTSSATGSGHLGHH